MIGLGLGEGCLGLGGWPCVKTMVLQMSNVAIYVCISCFSLYLLLQIAVCGAIYCFGVNQYFHVAHSQIKCGLGLDSYSYGLDLGLGPYGLGLVLGTCA